MKNVIRILSIDGNGVGGMIPARIIQRLNEKFPDFCNKVDLFAGTSSGGLSVLALAGGLTLEKLCDLYINGVPNVFSKAMERKRVRWLLNAKFSNEGLKELITKTIGKRKLGNLPGNIFIPVLALQRDDGGLEPSGVFLSTAWRLSGNQNYEKYMSSQWSCLDAAVATASAPTFFQAHQVESPMKMLCWDGGLVAGNPSLAAVTEILQLCQKEETLIPDIRVLSFGCGVTKAPVDAGDWGLLQCGKAVPFAMLSAQKDSEAYKLGQSINTLRIDPFCSAYELDDPNAICIIDKVATDFNLMEARQPDGSMINIDGWFQENWL